MGKDYINTQIKKESPLKKVPKPSNIQKMGKRQTREKISSLWQTQGANIPNI